MAESERKALESLVQTVAGMSDDGKRRDALNFADGFNAAVRVLGGGVLNQPPAENK